MGTFAENLARRRVAAVTGTVPPDLGRWAVETIADLAPVAECVGARNVLLRAAATRVSGSRWARARRLERKLESLRNHPRVRDRVDDDGVRELLAYALEMAPAPKSLRRLLTLLAG